ncbi:MarR family winged helix-turn-helix transcriptional regulator [Arthrobacter bambusae]|uniref:MarR family winged helix-turn-helix transcriptional regulator n=1 Tax=Arthrobacter bambusae TaxID=1338426 RepID=UPI0027836BB1|nr:MarR family transcriptional regulator [Arthrobacter bambusae]MDQ0029977.1 DNA-binding MarR family transcriptional regulator [Arthrobacter bambusae]MDQ0097505.1 DNA-binding MarR family transcriptional regulator [Arthrobacter bambusae]
MHSQPSDPADLGDLFHAAFRGLRRTWAEQLSPWELTPHQWRALVTLMRRHPSGSVATGSASTGSAPTAEQPGRDAPAAGEPMRLKDLAERLRIAPRSATEVVDQLEVKGLVRRDPDPTDRRATLVAATPAGQQLFAKISAERRGKSSEYFARLSAGDRAELARILGQLGD